jgi:hypothetical protein
VLDLASSHIPCHRPGRFCRGDLFRRAPDITKSKCLS